MSKRAESVPNPNRDASQNPSENPVAKSGGPEPDVDDGTKAGKRVTVPSKPHG
jgi:hypothetical protein